MTSCPYFGAAASVPSCNVLLNPDNEAVMSLEQTRKAEQNGDIIFYISDIGHQSQKLINTNHKSAIGN